MKDKIKTELPNGFLELLIAYVENRIRAYRPDHQDADLALRMMILAKLRTRLLKRQAEVLYAPTLKITVPKEEALALLAQWMDDAGTLTAIHVTTDMAVRRITDVAHKNWM